MNNLLSKVGQCSKKLVQWNKEKFWHVGHEIKTLLQDVISESQSAPGQLITDNILITYEIFHSMHKDTKVGGTMAIKLDMSKAYNRVGWSFFAKCYALDGI